MEATPWDGSESARLAWLDAHAFANAELALAMSCVRPARSGELAMPTTVIAVQSRRGMVSLYWAPVLKRPGALESARSIRKGERDARTRILGVVDLAQLAKLDPTSVPHRFGFWRGNGRGAKGAGEASDPEADARRDRLKGRER